MSLNRPAGSNKQRWVRDLRRFLPLKSHFVLSGNVRDYQILEHVPGVAVPAPLIAVIDAELKSAGFPHVLVYEPLLGFRSASILPEVIVKDEGVLRELGLELSEGRAPAGTDLLADVLDRLARRRDDPVSLIVDFASRLVVREDMLSEHEHRLFTRAYIASLEAQPLPYGAEGRPFFNNVLWVVEKEVDLPDWLVIGNPRIRHIPVAKPDHRARRSVSGAVLQAMPGSLDGATVLEVERTFVEATEGLLLGDMMAIAELGRAENVEVSQISEAVRRYKLGVTDDPWKNLDRDRIRNGEAFVSHRVRGQSHAVTHMLDIIKCAVTGVGGAGRHGRPRGVAFLAGPTGVGKTELAKTITELLFGDESAYIRFDMSEFSAEHADQRLIGAPPGYVGYDAGGELTNAIRERPFSVVLFDEIEKAHPRILDKFLQILDDGVLTSGRGDRVYFSDALIVFTSNLGIYRTDEAGRPLANVTPEDALETLENKVTEEIGRYFKHVLNRPEILNRLGENIIVFDWIRPEIGAEILDQMIAATLQDVAAQEIIIDIAPAARASLGKICLADLSNGGRGVRNQVDAHLVKPLARALFDIGATSGQHFRIDGIIPNKTTGLTLTRVDG